MRRPPHNLAFTLMELVLVMVVIAVCAAIAAPSLRGFANGRLLPNAATTLVTTARWCRTQALSDGVEYRLNIDTSGGKWWVTKDDGTGTNFVDVTDEFGRQYTLPDGITITDLSFQNTLGGQEGANYISFRPGGQTDVAKITLTSEKASAIVGCDTPLGSFRIFPEGSP